MTNILTSNNAKRAKMPRLSFASTTAVSLETLFSTLVLESLERESSGMSGKFNVFATEF